MLKRIRRGFTLAEVLVTVAVIAVVAAVVVPAVVRQVTAGDPARVSQDLQAIRTGIENFHLNTRVYPLEIEDLLFSDQLPAGANAATWRGPYLDKTIGTLDVLEPTADAFATGFNRQIRNGFLTCQFNEEVQADEVCEAGNDSDLDRYVTVLVRNLTLPEFDLVNVLVDGPDATSTTGRLRFTASATFYFAYPVVAN